MVIYDIDGVLLPDIDNPSHELCSLIASSVVPLFRPEHPFGLITGRTVEERSTTMFWLDKYRLLPDVIYHENDKPENSLKYKIEILNKLSPKPDLVVESGYSMAKSIQVHTGIKTIVFHELIRNAIRATLYLEEKRCKSV